MSYIRRQSPMWRDLPLCRGLASWSDFVSGGTESSRTRWWREMDSNPRSLSRGSRFILRKVNCAGIDGRPKKIWRGTDGSNPSPSSGESRANLTSSAQILEKARSQWRAWSRVPVPERAVGPLDLIYVPGFVSNVELAWEWPCAPAGRRPSTGLAQRHKSASDPDREGLETG
jgi:hypothetical protein